MSDEDELILADLNDEELTEQVMDDLYELGARAILTTAIHACRL